MIDRETWIEIIKDFQESSLPDLIEREKKIDVDIPIKRAISIIGPRRTGKTYFMYQLISNLIRSGIDKSRLLYINLEREPLAICDSADLSRLLNIFYEIYPENLEKKCYIFLDEIQNVENWERFVRTAMDNRDIQIFISGSSSKLLSREISTSMRGRTISEEIYPFSFREFLLARDFKIEKYMSTSKKLTLLNLLNKFLLGSYPEVVIYEKEREKILSEILDVTIYRDIIERYSVKNIKALRLTITGAANSPYFSVHKFSNYLKSLGIKVSKNTIYSYLEYLNDSMILYQLRKFSKSYKEIYQSIPKLYFVDNGFLLIQGIKHIGRFMEGVVFVELIRRGFKINRELFYYKKNEHEVDFLIREGAEVKQLIQVTYASGRDEIEKREFKSLVKASDEFGCKNLLLITWDYEDEINLDGKTIKCIPLWKWLLSIDSWGVGAGADDAIKFGAVADGKMKSDTRTM